MKRKMKKLMSLLMALSMSFSMFTLPVQASPGINTEMEQNEASETTEADDNHAAAAEITQPAETQQEELQPEKTQPEAVQSADTQSEETQPEAVQPAETGHQTFTLRGGASTFQLDAGDIDVSSVSAANVVPDDGTEVDDNSPMMISVEEELGEIQVLAANEEGSETTTALTSEQIENILYMFQQYQEQWKSNANVLGVQTPFFLKYNDNNEDGLGILGEMLVLAGHTVDDVRNGAYSYDDLMGVLQTFYYADQFGIEFYGDTIASRRDEVLEKVEKSGAGTFVQKVLVVNDWIAHNANFDMAYIMNMGRENPVMTAENPEKHEHYDEIYDAMYEVYEDPITQQFHDQIEAGVVAGLRQQYYENFIWNVIYNQTLGEMETDADHATEEQKKQASDTADQFMSDHADAIAEDAPGFVTDTMGSAELADQMAAGADAFIETARKDGVDISLEDGSVVKMTVEELTQQMMATEKIVDLDGDGVNETTANEAILIYTDQAAVGLTNGIFGAWEGSHIGILTDGLGVCAGYSRTFAYLLQCMCPEQYGVNGSGTDMSVSSNWKTADELYYDADGNIDITKDYVVDMVRITFNANVSMFGEDSTFAETHFWNAVQVDGKWYYVDSCYIDAYVECMSYDRVEMDGALNNMYFMLSHSSAYEMYKGYMKEIATLYDGEGVSDDTSYEESWFARISSNAYFSDGKVYYLYDATDQLAMMREYRNYQNSGSSSNMQSSDFEALIEGKNPTFRLVYHTIRDTDIKEDGADSDFTTLIEFNHKEDSSGSYDYDTEEETTALVYNPKTNAMEENELLTTLFAQYKEECDIYPSIKLTTALYGGKLYFNLSNCILSYELSSGKVEKVKEYNTVYGKRDKSNAFGGLAFSVVDNAEEADLQVINHPIAALTIKDDGKMYVSVATNYAFISGKKTVDDSSSFGYEFEESNFNPDYSVYTRKESGEINDNDEFMWSAVFVDRIDMSASCAHTYESVTIAPTCGRDGYTENRCTKCDAPQADSRVVDEGSAFDAHHYVHYDETYYTKDSDGNRNTGECYVCTVCGYAVEEPDEPESDATEEEIETYEKEKEIWDNAVATAGHTYEPADAVWSDDCSSVTFSRLECSSICPDRKEYLDCLVEDSTVSVECKQTTAEAAAVCEGSCETGVVMIYSAEGVTEDGYKYAAAKEVKREAGQHTYENGVCTVCGEKDFSAEAPVITSVYSKVQTSVKVTWNKVEGADGYELWRTDDANDGEWICAKTIKSTDVDKYTNKNGEIYYTNQDLNKGTTYYYKVRAYALKTDASEGNSDKRIYSDFSAVDYMPAAVVYKNVYSNSTSRIRILWNQVGGSHGYQIWRKEAGADDEGYKVIKTIGDKGNELTDDQGATTAYSNTGLEAGKAYTYKIRAFYIPETGKKVYGAYSDEMTVAVKPEVTVLSGSSSKAESAVLSWTKVSGAKGYQIWMAESSNGSYKIIKSIDNGTTTSYTKDGLTSGKSYYFKIRAYVEVDGKKTFGEYSDAVSVLVK